MNFQGHPARQWNRKASTAAVLLLSLVVAACGTTGGGGFGGAAESRAKRLAQAGEFQEAAGVYIGLAAEASGSERDRLTLLAVDNWLDAGDEVRAQNAFRGVAQPPGGELLLRWNSTRAAMLLYEGEAAPARDLLESLSRQSLPPEVRLRVEGLRADAWFQLQDPTRAIELLMQRESWLDDRQSIERNRERLWQGLLVSDPLVGHAQPVPGECKRRVDGHGALERLGRRQVLPGPQRPLAPHVVLERRKRVGRHGRDTRDRFARYPAPAEKELRRDVIHQRE